MNPFYGILKVKTILLIFIFSMSLLVSCSTIKKHNEQLPEQELSAKLYQSVQQEYQAGKYSASLHIANELIDHHVEFSKLDHVYRIAIDSIINRGDNKKALEYIDEFLNNFDKSKYRDSVYISKIEILLELNRDVQAAKTIIQLHGDATSSAGKQHASSAISELAPKLTAEQLSLVREGSADKGLGPYLGYLEIEALLAKQRPRQAAKLYQEIKRDNVENEWIQKADQLLKDPEYVHPAEDDDSDIIGEHDPYRIAVLAPLTGRYTVLGNAFYDGAELARKKAEEQGWRQYILSVHDTEGDPVTAALATRELLETEKPIAIIGGLLSSPTVSISLVADDYGVSTISPTATNDRINEIGSMIFQPNLTGMFESRLLARTAIELLLKKRVAILYPGNSEGMRRYQAFADEVIRLGGEVVAAVSYNTNHTDFKEPMNKISEHNPEVIFVPASVDEMKMIGPQLDFYRTGSLVMGPSEWDNVKLASVIGKVMERAIFPSDTALYPSQWLEDFDKSWDRTDLPTEATLVAKRSYLATMLVLFSLGEGGYLTSNELAGDLDYRLFNRLDQELDSDTMEQSLRMFLDYEIVKFPIDRYEGAFASPDSTADSLQVVLPDSLPVLVE